MGNLAERMGLPRRWRLMLVDGDRAAMDAAARMLTAGDDMTIVGTATQGNDALGVVADYRPDVVLLDQGLVRPSALETAQHVLRLVPGTWVFLTTPVPSIELWQEAKASGVRAMLPKPYTYADIADAISRAHEEDQRHGALTVGRADQAPASPTMAATLRTVRQEIICAFSPKGGVGKSTLVSNLGVLYALQRTGLRVAAVDFDLATASLGVQLGLPKRPARTLADWVGVDAASLDRARVETLLVQHESGLWVLPAPSNPLDRMRIPPETFTNVIEAMRRLYDIVLYDLPTSSLDRDYALAAMKDATTVLLIINPDTEDVSAMDDATNLLISEEMRRLGFDNSKVKLVINRRPKHGAHSIADVMQVSRFPAIGQPIPEDPRVRRHTNVEEHGRAAIERLGSTPWAASVRSLARNIVPIAELSESKARRRPDKATAPRAPGRTGLFGRVRRDRA